MSFNSWGFIYLEVDDDGPTISKSVIERGGVTTTIVGVTERSAVVQAALDLVDGGAQLVELCGAFGPTWAAEVIEAVGGRVPVGAVGYGVESVPALASLFAPATA